MINELIEKEIEKFFKYIWIVPDCQKNFGTIVYQIKEKDLETLHSSFKTIAKEVAMKFKGETYDSTNQFDHGEQCRQFKINLLADQVINEVSK